VHFGVKEFKENVATFEENCTVVVLSLLQRASEGFGTPFFFFFWPPPCSWSSSMESWRRSSFS
jgi:hypothetical protein